LGDAALSGGTGAGTFAWAEPNTVLSVPGGSYLVIFTPADSANYALFSEWVSLAVNAPETPAAPAAPASTPTPAPAAARTTIPQTQTPLAPSADADTDSQTPQVRTPAPSAPADEDTQDGNDDISRIPEDDVPQTAGADQAKGFSFIPWGLLIIIIVIAVLFAIIISRRRKNAEQ
jgi:hypothetical protein